MSKNLTRAMSAAILTASLSACTSSLDVSRVASMSCGDLNSLVGDTSKEISTRAVSRGRVQNFDPPPWVLGAARGKQALADRQTRRIAGLKATQDSAKASVLQRCR